MLAIDDEAACVPVPEEPATTVVIPDPPLPPEAEVVPLSNIPNHVCRQRVSMACQTYWLCPREIPLK